MKKNINLEKVTKLINKCMDENRNICLYLCEDGDFESCIDITKIENDKTMCLSISWRFKEDKLIIYVNRNCYYDIKVSDPKEILEWKMLIEKIKDYTIELTENKFNSFSIFANPICNIDDLDDGDLFK